MARLTHFKGLVKPFLPPVVLTLYRRLWPPPSAPKREPQKTWEGIYLHLLDVPRVGVGFGGTWWIGMQRSLVEKFLANLQTPGVLLSGVTGDRVLLPLVASIVWHQTGFCRVLDFGGGLGLSYFQLKSSLPACESVEYTIVETAGVCAEGRRLFSQDAGIRFVTEVPSDIAVDIVYCDSALQYVENYAELLATLCTACPQYILFVRLPAGKIPATYATAQLNLPEGQRIPHWFFNVDEIQATIAKYDYRPLLVVAGEQECPQDNFPPTTRIGYTCNLLFARVSGLKRQVDG